jgi:hypothetical protein
VGKLPFILGGFIDQLARRGSGKNKLFIFGLGEVCWALWKVRNKMAIENVMIKSPVTIMFNVISFFAAMESAATGQGEVLGAIKLFKEKLGYSGGGRSKGV